MSIIIKFKKLSAKSTKFLHSFMVCIFSLILFFQTEVKMFTPFSSLECRAFVCLNFNCDFSPTIDDQPRMLSPAFALPSVSNRFFQDTFIENREWWKWNFFFFLTSETSCTVKSFHRKGTKIPTTSGFWETGANKDVSEPWKCSPHNGQPLELVVFKIVLQHQGGNMRKRSLSKSSVAKSIHNLFSTTLEALFLIFSFNISSE